MFTLERAAASPRVGLASLIGLVLVPLLVAGGFLWATWNSDTRLDRVQAAIVNEDKPVRLNGQLVPLGRQLAGGLVTGGDEVAADENFDWLLTDSDDAAAGLASGRYAAVVRIPANFSARATSFSKSEAAQIGPAEISVETSQIRGISDGVVGQTIATAATAALNTSLTKNYLDNIYIGFNKTKKQFESVAKGARELADGTEQVSDGLGQTSTGTKQLADGLDQLDDGAQQLATGTGQLSTGTRQLSDGLEKLAAGTKELPGGARKLADGAQKSADGAGKLATGTQKLASGLGDYRRGTKQAAAGADEFAAGLGSYAENSEAFAAGAGQFSGGLGEYAKFLRILKAADPDQLAKLGISCPAPDPQACALFYGGIQAAGTAAEAGLTSQPSQQKSLLAGAKGLAAGADGLAGGATKLAAGADGLSTGIAKLDGGAKKLAAGAGELSGGTRQLANGLDQLADGTDQLADGLKPLATGISQTSTGATKLASGVSELATGTKDLANGTAQSATGARKLSDGLVKLDDGAGKLADGSDELATGLEKGAKQVPTYDKTVRTKLAEVVATPVTAEQPKSLFADIANTTFLAAIALWLGGLASFIVLRAVPAGTLTSMKSSWRLALGAFLPAAGIAAVQAVALTIVLQVLLGLDAARVVQLLPFLLLAGLAFAAVNQGLVAWLGGIGRFVSVALVVLSAAAAITSAVPAVFDVLTPFLPLTPALEGARAIISNGAGTVGTVGLMVAWLIIGAAASVLAVARRRIAPARAPALAPT